MRYWIGMLDFLYPYPENNFATLAEAEEVREYLLKRHNVTEDQTIIFRARDAGEAYRKVQRWAGLA